MGRERALVKMRVLVTGAFGNVGRSTVDELLKQGHRVRCFDLKTRANTKTARSYGDRIEVVWGDLRSPADLAAAVSDQDAGEVLHLGPEPVQYRRFCLCVHAGKSIIQNQYVGFDCKGSGNGDSLLLTSGEGYPPLSDHCLKSFGESFYFMLYVDYPRQFPNPVHLQAIDSERHVGSD